MDREEASNEQSVEVEIVVSVEAGSSAAGKKIKELDWLDGGVIVRIEREGRWMLPKGDTEILQNDKLTLHVPPANAAKITRCIAKI